MKNPIALAKSSPVVSKVIGEVSKFYLNHESAILMSGNIGFSLAATGVALKNAEKISDILRDSRDALATCNSKEERNKIYKLVLSEMTPLVAPIIIFQGLSITCSILSKRKMDLKDKKIAELAGAVSIAQTAVAQYQAFAKEAETALGDKKYEKLQEDISKNITVDGRRFKSIASEGAPGEILMIDKYSGKPFWSTPDRVDYAAKELSRRISPEGGYDIQTIDDWYDLIGNKDLITDAETGVLARKFGYVSGSFRSDDICTRLTDSHYRFPNGTVIPAFIVRLSPEPACIDSEAD